MSTVRYLRNKLADVISYLLKNFARVFERLLPMLFCCFVWLKSTLGPHHVTALVVRCSCFFSAAIRCVKGSQKIVQEKLRL